MLQNPIGVFLYGDKEKAQNIIVEIEKDGKNFLVGLSLNYNRTGIDVNSIRGLFPKDLHEWLLWIQQNKALYLNKEKVQNLIAQQQTNFADVSNLDLNSISNIIQNFKNPSLETEKNQKNQIVFREKIPEKIPGFLLLRRRRSGRRRSYRCCVLSSAKALRWINQRSLPRSKSFTDLISHPMTPISTPISPLPKTIENSVAELVDSGVCTSEVVVYGEDIVLY